MKIPSREFFQRETSLLVESQKSFDGGMNLLSGDTDISDTEYLEAFNCLNVEGVLEPIKYDIEIGANIQGKKQGIYSFGGYLILFANGFVYYKSPGDLSFSRLSDIRLSSTVDRIYTAFIPPSTSNFQRYLGTSTDESTIKVDPTTIINNSPQGLIAQDGISQPLLIYIDGNSIKSRFINNYDKWQKTAREYVPVGLDMMFLDGILFVISPDRTRLYRSVTNRPLDFVVNVTSNGDKGGDAETTNYAVSYSRITALMPLSSASFMVCTDTPFSYQITLNREKTIFGEPTFKKDDLFSTSAINSFSIVDILGDSAIITQRGIRSFNASRQLKLDSQNAIFSKKIRKAFSRTVLQDELGACINFQDYALFSVLTIYGQVIAVYDTVQQVWSSFIILQKSNGKVKQFASLVPYLDKLYAITTDDKILELFIGEYATSFVATKRFAFDDLRVNQILGNFRYCVENQLKNGNITVSAFVDNKLAETKVNALSVGTNNTIENDFPRDEGLAGITNANMEFSTNPKTGWKIGYNIRWFGGGSLSAFNHIARVDETIINQQEKGKK